jgi:hypothetical protein
MLLQHPSCYSTKNNQTRKAIPAMLIVLLVGMQLFTIRAAAQSNEAAVWQPVYAMPSPAGWAKEHFPLPPDFAPTFIGKGTEDIRFHPGWGDSTSEGYWSYTYLWWLDGIVTFSESMLEQNLKAYYAGLVGRNIESRKIPAEKVVPTVAAVKKIKTADKDRQTYSATIRMLDYMTQKPMVLNGLIHVKDALNASHSIVLIEVSPQAAGHAVWKQMDEIVEGFVPSQKR